MPNRNISLLKVLPILLGIFFAGFTMPAFCLEYTLQNDLVQASFNEQGIDKFHDKKLQRTVAFSADDFKFSINGRLYTNKEATFDGVTQGSNELSYHYHVPGFAVRLVYSLDKDCFFLSKQLVIKPDNADGFIVNQLNLIMLQLKEKINSFYIPHTKHPELKTGDYGVFLRLNDVTGMVVLIQNPFLTCTVKQQEIAIAYEPAIKWKKEYGDFKSDISNIGMYQLTGNAVSANMIPEWKWTNGIIPITNEEQDEAEVTAFTKIVSHYILPHTSKSIKINIGWCENDYQIDLATAAGRLEYKRIIDQSAALGLDHILFTPANSKLGSREQATDDWGWENILWLGLGIKIREGSWDVEKDKIPPSIQEMLDYAKRKKVKLVSYLYPVLPFSGNPEWIVEGSPHHQKNKNANLGIRSFQDYLIKILSKFYERTGISGYSYDYTYLWYEGASRYEQWKGWCRVKETLRKKYPEMIIDGRQADHLYGPWSWISGSFPHPTAEDEQPESFLPFPDLHFDRVSANRQRYTAYRYRINDFCPPEIMPGFMFHQTPRMQDKDGKPFLRVDGYRQRDWDYLGWKYSLFSSIATGGLNNVVNMIPARDIEEMKHFGEVDKKFIRNWINWTDTNRVYLLQTKFILGQPALGKIDGTSAILNDKGFIFLFNPNARSTATKFFLDAAIGLTQRGNYEIKMRYPYEGKLIAPPSGKMYWQQGDLFRLEMDGATAMMFEIKPAVQSLQLFNLMGLVKRSGASLQLDGVKGEMGTVANWKVSLDTDEKLTTVTINGKSVSFNQQGKSVTGSIKFEGQPFTTMQQVGKFEPAFTGGKFQASFQFPEWVSSQLKDRTKKWPIPWTSEDYQTTWLVPERLLLFVQVAECTDTMEVKLLVDGKAVNLQKAYSSVRPNKGSFVGWYYDASQLKATINYKLELLLPTLKPGQFQGIFVENIEPSFTSQFAEGEMMGDEQRGN